MSGVCKRTQSFTSLAGARPVSSASAVADESIPSFFAHALVFAGVALALLPRLLAAGRFDASTILGLCNLPDVFASAVDEEVPDAAHVAVAEHGGPELRGQDEVAAVRGEASQVHVALQVQDLTLPTGCERRPAAVH